jgi:hypothetical protein
VTTGDPRHFDERVAAEIRATCQAAGSYRAAARRVGTSAGYLNLLAHGKRRPSTAMAEALIAGLDFDAAAATRLRELAIPGVGRSFVVHPRSAATAANQTGQEVGGGPSSCGSSGERCRAATS